MTALDQFYRAYYEYIKSVSSLKSHDNYVKTLESADKGKDSHNGNVVRREIDMDWVEAIEFAIPYIDAAIRENRRFISQEEEIVPIEKSRKITSESVRHLAQHTNMIAKVEGDEVTPESILNIYREESFAIYENRFLRTLIDNTSRFVEKRYQALLGHSESFVADLAMERDFQFEQETTQFKFEYKSEYKERETFDIHADLSTLSDFERVTRVRKILSDFSATPLMRELKNAEPVRPPITRTNLLLRNPNFRTALDLWAFIETYTKNGYRTVTSSAEGNMEPGMQGGIYDALDFFRFSLRLQLSPPLREMLQNNYDTEERERELKAQRLEEERQQREKLRLEKAVDEERKSQEQIRAELISRHEQEMSELRSEWESTVERLKVSYAKHLLQIKEENEANIARLTEMFETKLSQQEESARAAIESQKAEFDKTISEQKAEFDSTLSKQRAQYISECKAIENKWQAVLSKTTDKYEAQIKNEREEHRKILLETAAKYTEHLENEKYTYQTKFAESEAGFKVQLESERSAHEKELAGVEAKLTSLLEKERSELTSKLNSTKAERDSIVSDLSDKLDKLSAEYKNDTQVLRKQIGLSEKRASTAESTVSSLTTRIEQQEKEYKKLKQRADSVEARYDKKYEAAEERFKTKLEKQERNSSRKIERLEKKLKKALKKCPYQEVMAEDNEQD